MPGKRSGKAVASIDAAGSAIGSLGLIAFGLFVWRMQPRHSTWTVLVLATLLWAGVAFAAWIVRKSLRKDPQRFRRKRRSA